MKRFLPIPVLCSAALLAVLCACTPDSASTATDTLSDTAQPFTGEEAAPAEKVTQPVATGFVNLNRADQTMMGSGSDTGFYQILYRLDNSANLTYVDYATAQEIFLCASPNCTHDNESCSAWLPPEDLSCVPLVVGDRLLLFDRISFSGGTEGQAHPMRLFSAGLDGSGRKLLTEFDGSESCFSVISANETMLVMQVTRADEQGAATGQTLVSVNLDTGERSDFYPIPQGQNVQFAGVTENGYCVLYSVQETLSEEDFQGEDWGESSAVMDSGKVYTWSVVPVGGSRQETVCQRSGICNFWWRMTDFIPLTAIPASCTISACRTAPRSCWPRLRREKDRNPTPAILTESWGTGWCSVCPAIWTGQTRTETETAATSATRSILLPGNRDRSPCNILISARHGLSARWPQLIRTFFSSQIPRAATICITATPSG